MTRPIVFLSDYGLQDEYVGVCHGVIARIAPEARVIDLSHAIPAHDVLRGAVILAGSSRFMPERAVFLAVVDPGVGTQRRSVAIETSSGATLVGPDNGVLSMAWDEQGGAVRAVEITSSRVLLDPVSDTFHGRDVFAPAAAHLAAGLGLEDLGPAVPLDVLVRVLFPAPTAGPDGLHCVVLSADRFGNLQLAARPADLEPAGLAEVSRLQVTAGDYILEVPRARTFADLSQAHAGITVDSAGFLALVVNGGSAAQSFGVGPGDDVLLARPG
ncbi:MAG: SAM-dependent chlorinase/fluorinase [Actinomycetota bacterium]|nr:SAM-dependent chlorinase/fluorinase [Actinomycetota bacterium]